LLHLFRRDLQHRFPSAIIRKFDPDPFDFGIADGNFGDSSGNFGDSSLYSLGPIFSLQSLNLRKTLVIRDQYPLFAQRVGSDQHVEGRNDFALPFQSGPCGAVTLGGGSIPWQHFDAQKKFHDRAMQFFGFWPFGEAELQLSFGDG
jgi:hypothetical protein